MMGMSPSTGIFTALNVRPELRSGCDTSMRSLRYPVSPAASTLSTTPRMIWSARKRIENTASSAPSSPPASDPVSRPSHSTPNALATTAAANAPSSSWPSMAMLITPDRSHMQPARAPSTSGIERFSVLCNRLTTLSGMALPAYAQHSSEITKNSSTRAILRRLTRLDSSTNAANNPITMDAAPSV